MFKSARFKLTGWYLLIIMFISIFFSVVIYVGMTRELERGLRRAELRFRAEELNIPLPRPFSDLPEDLPPRLREMSPRFSLIEDLEAAKKRLALNLLIINGVILGVSAVAGYFLAGKTLKPIEKAMEEQKRFVADASHELRTPLTALKTSMEVALKDRKMTTKGAKKILRSSLEEVDSLHSLTSNLLSLAQYQKSSDEYIFEPLNVAEIVKSVYKKIHPLAEKKGVAIKLNVKNIALTGDRVSLEKMITIFLDNAVKYTPRGGRVSLTAWTDKKYLLIKVKDTGIGIDKKDIPHIFDRFYRADQSRSKDKAAGFGLGLSLARKIIEIHKGSVETSSILGKGTTFTVKFPRKYS